MYNLGVVMISGGAGMRGNLFTSRMGDVFGGRAPAPAPRPQLGQTGVGNYTQLKAEIAQWDSLVQRLQRINNQTVMMQIAGQFGINNPTDNTKGQYMRNRSAMHIAQADASSPVNYSLFDPSTPGPAKNDAKDLASFLTDFSAAVTAAENTYGIAATPTIITNTVSTTPDWVLPVVAGAGALALLAILGVFGGKKK
jgi:hypothetical protein